MSISHVKCSFIKATEGVGANIRTASSFQSCFPELLGEAPTAAPRFCSLPTDLRWIQTFRPTRKNSDSSHPSMSPVCQAHHLHTRGNAYRTHTLAVAPFSAHNSRQVFILCTHFFSTCKFVSHIGILEASIPLPDTVSSVSYKLKTDWLSWFFKLSPACL